MAAAVGCSLAQMQEAVLLCNLATDAWVLAWANPQFAALTGEQQPAPPAVE